MNLKESLETIKDSRIDRCKKHSLVDILMIVFFGLLCGYKSIESIHLYAELSINVLKKYLVLANGIPSIISLRFRHGGEKITNLC